MQDFNSSIYSVVVHGHVTLYESTFFVMSHGPVPLFCHLLLAVCQVYKLVVCDYMIMAHVWS